MADDDSIRLSASSSGLAGVAIHVGDVRALERLSTPYEVSILLSLDDDTADPADMLGKDFELEVARESVTRRFVGVVREVTFANRLGDRNVIWHEVKIVPALHFLSMRRDTRIFQDKSALEIVEIVLDEALGPLNRTVDVLATATYPKREYCVQYQETDLDFVHRLMEEEGIGYFFSHDGAKEVLTLTDANAQFVEAPTIGGDGVVHHREDARPVEGIDAVHRFERTRSTTTTSVAVRDYDFSGAQTPDAEERSEDELGRDRESYEHGRSGSVTIGDYAGTAFGANDAARQALLRQQMHLAGGTVMRGAGHVVGFGPGHTFSVVDHPLVGFDGEYVLTEVEHHWSDGRSRERRVRSGSQFVCIPVAAPYRPARRTPKPFVAGFETAIVTGPAGEEIHTDEHGRIKVQLHWDRDGANDDKTTCFIRVRQPWAGSGWGFVFLPRIGMEVVVSFADGDPDRPFVEGCVYNSDHAPPYSLPDEKTKSTIKSQSSPQSPAGFNELRFEDKAGSEEVFTHAQKDQNEIVLNNHTTTVGGNQENIVGKTQTQKVHKNQTEEVTGTQTMKVGTDRTVHVKGSFTETIASGELCKIDGGVTETITSFESRTVTGGFTDNITGGELRLVGGGFKEDITGTHDQHVLGPNAEVMLAGSTQTVTAGPVTFDTAGTHTMLSGGPIAYNGMAGIKQYAATITETIGGELKYDPEWFAHDWTKSSSTVTAYSFVGTKTAITVAAAAAGVLKLSVFGKSVGFTGVKFGATGVKVDVYAYKPVKAAVQVSPATIEAATN